MFMWYINNEAKDRIRLCNQWRTDRVHEQCLAIYKKEVTDITFIIHFQSHDKTADG